jgi:excisionase family DNA binding protein
MNTDTKPADPPQSQQNKLLQRKRAKRVQRRREKAAGRRRAKRVQHEGDVQPPRLAWPIDEGAHRIGVGRTSVYKLAAEGKLRLIKVAGRTLIPDAEVVRVTTEGA